MLSDLHFLKGYFGFFKRYSTFLYCAQPILNIVTIFAACDKCAQEVKLISLTQIESTGHQYFKFQFDMLASALIINSKTAVGLEYRSFLKKKSVSKYKDLESTLVQLKSLRVRFRVFNMIDIDNSALCDVGLYCIVCFISLIDFDRYFRLYRPFRNILSS